MKPDATKLKATKPKKTGKRNVQLDFKELFKTLGKGLVDFSIQSWGGVAKDAVDAVGAFGLEKATPEELAYRLIHRAMARAAADLVGEIGQEFIGVEPAKLTKVPAGTAVLDNVTIRRDFFAHPEALGALADMKTILANWLNRLGLKRARADSLAARMDSYFVHALVEEWRTSPGEYSRINEFLETPFADAADRDLMWRQYNALLCKQADEPVFGESFGLRQVYVPLRAHYAKAKGTKKAKYDREDVVDPMEEKGSEPTKIVVDLESYVDEWLDRDGIDDAVQVVTGGPGSGKSTFTKIFAAKVAAEGQIKVVYVPLHLFNHTGDLTESLGKFVEGRLPVNPLDPASELKRLLLIFDGLDELVKMGAVAVEQANEFVAAIDQTVRNCHTRGLCLRVLLTGREVVIQANKSAFRRVGQIVTLFPYFVSKDDREDFEDKDRLLSSDQRNDWWTRYGESTGRGYKGMPKDLEQSELDDITKEPLLNYLVALSYEHGEVDYTAETSRNAVYEDLLHAVYDRGYAGRPLLPIRQLDYDDYERVLEEIAVAAWHGDGRTTTVASIVARCAEGGLDAALESFQVEAKKGVTRLLTAFYFRQHEVASGTERTFEFTHKSFGEYLIARRIVSELETIHAELEERTDKKRRGWTKEYALENWAKLCGPTAMDWDLLRFLRDEVRRKPRDAAESWQRMLVDLIGHLLRNGMPMGALRLGSYRTETIHARNAEEALLAALFACAEVTESVSEIDWPTTMSAGNWIHVLQASRFGGAHELARGIFAYLDFTDQDLSGIDFAYANLRNSQLGSAEMTFASLPVAKLTGSDLQGAELRYTQFVMAYLQGADLRGADLRSANLRSANLQDADLRGADLQGADLRGTFVSRSQLEEADGWTDDQIKDIREP